MSTSLIPVSGLSLLGALAAVGVLVLIAGLVGVFVIVVVANRAEPDQSGYRPFVVYLFALSFVTLFVALTASTEAVSALIQLIGSHRGFVGTGLHPVGDEVARGAVIGGLVTIVSVAALLTHLLTGVRLTGPEEQDRGPSGRVVRSYLAAVSFVSVLVIISAVVVMAYSICQVAGPGTFGSTGGRIGPGRHAIDAAYLAAASLVILCSHLRLARARGTVLRFLAGHHGAP